MTVIDRITTWVDVCAREDLIPDRGACALVGPYQVALFRLSLEDVVYGISNYDPFSKSFVLSRGIVGSKGGTPKVSSPLYKQSFDLTTGVCLEDPTVSVTTFPVRVVDGYVLVGYA